MTESVVQLRCGIKHDGWGKKGKESLAAQLWSKTQGNGPVDDGEPYSELWMGTYPSNPSYVLSSGEPLADYLKNNPQLIGKGVLSRWGPEIPFLPKILSFSKALTLQIHPDKALAESLHEVDPQRFGDSNHKPEIAVALSKFELFVGWKPLNDIQALFELDPLKRLVPQFSDFNNETLREICKILLSASRATVAEVVKELRETPEYRFGTDVYIPRMLDRLSEQYSQFDNGNLVATLLMNYMTVSPGEAICVPADSIHAYLHGDIVECMARSDNVLNTGFCPQAERDNISLFTRALTFKPHGSHEAMLPKTKSTRGINGKTNEYTTPFGEFNVLATWLGAGENETHERIMGPSLMIVTKGSGRMNLSGKSQDISEGHVFFIGQDVLLNFASEEGMVLYRAYAE